MLAIRDYEQAPYLVLATRNGLVKKTRLGDYNSPRQAGVIAINFREDDDELIGAELVDAEDDILLVSRKGQAIRFRADDTQLRPMGRATSGVTGHEVPRRRRAAVDVGDPRRAGRGRGGRRGEAAEAERAPTPATCRTSWSSTSSRSPTAASPSAPGSPSTGCSRRGGIGIKAMKLATRTAGSLVGAFIVVEGDEVLRSSSPARSSAAPIDEQFRATGRATKGVKFVGASKGDARRGGGPQRRARAEDRGGRRAPTTRSTVDGPATTRRSDRAGSGRGRPRVRQSRIRRDLRRDRRRDAPPQATHR